MVSYSCSSDDDTQPITEPVTQPNPTDNPPDSSNEAPVLEAQTFTTPEDVTDDTVIGTVSATDAEEDALTFTIIQNDTDLFEITETGALSLATGKGLDFEKVNSHQVTVAVSDGTNTTNAIITITVENVIEPFITTWETTMANEEIGFEIDTNNFTYDYTVDWGDGTIETNQTTVGRHVYSAPGMYKVSITGLFPAIRIDINSKPENASKIKTIEAWGDNTWKSMEEAFVDCANLTYNAIDVPNLSEVEDMSFMFSNASSFNGNLSSWDVSNVVNMRNMFANALSFNQDINSWDVSKVTDMGGMFSNISRFNQDISNWNVSNVTNMEAMFANALSFNQDISGWNVSKVTDMRVMFAGADAFNQDIGSWDVSEVIDISSMFSSADSFNQDISGWDVSKVSDMSDMFISANSFNQDLSGWDVRNVNNCSRFDLNSGLSISNRPNFTNCSL